MDHISKSFGALNVADFLFCLWDWMGVYWFWNAVDVHQLMYLAIIFLSICPAICTSCIKKQKQKSKEHSGLMDREGNEKDSDEEKNQNPRFADN